MLYVDLKSVFLFLFVKQIINKNLLNVVFRRKIVEFAV